MYGVVQHSGSLHGGHYIAYVKYPGKDSEHNTTKHTEYRKEVSDGDESGYSKSSKVADNPVYQTVEDGGESGDQQKGVWYYTSDSYVTPVEKRDVENCQAYLLLYVRRK